MLLHIIRKEILEHLMSLRFAIACVLCFIVILASLFVRGQEYLLTMSDYREDAVGQRERVKSLDHPWQIVWRGLTVHQTPNPLKVFVRGVEEGNRISVTIDSHRPPQFVMEETRSPLMLLFPAMDLPNFVGVIMSLMAIVFGYNAICGEKEQGTLRLMLSYSVPRDRVLLGKMIGGYVTLVIPFILSVIGGTMIVLVHPNIDLSSLEWLKLGTVCALALVYIAAMYCLAVWVSCMTARSATSVMVLVTLWMLLVLAVPNLSPHVARVFAPTRNPHEVELARQVARQEVWKVEVEDKMEAYDRANGFGERWWESVDRSKWKGGRERGELRRLYENRLEKTGSLKRLESYERLDENFSRELNSQVNVSRWISRISPFSCFVSIATELTDTGILGKKRFLDQIKAHQKALCVYGYDEWLALRQYTIDNEGKRERWSKLRKKPVPVFSYVPPAGSEYFREVALDAGILVGMTLLFFMLSYLTFLRYDVR